MTTTKDASHRVDMTGLELEVDSVVVNGSALSGTELGFVDGVTAGTAAASKAVVLGASKEIATITTATITGLTSTTAAITTPTITGVLTLGTAASTTTNFDAQTCISNAATITRQFTVVTTESLSTAHTASQALTLTFTGVTTSHKAIATIIGGTNTGGVPVLKTACTSNTVTVTIQNNAIATNAFNGTFIIWLQVVL